MILADGPDAYQDGGLRPECPTRRFTVYVRFGGSVHYPGAIEEIDVDAVGGIHAREIAQAALARDYEPGGQIVQVDERVGLYL